MLNDKEFNTYIQEQEVSASATSYIDTTRKSNPAKAAGDGALLNMSCRLASRKMGHIVQAASRTVELPYAIHCELHPTVFEFWDQPRPIRLIRVRLSKKTNKDIRHVASYTGDYLTLYGSGPAIVECKSASAYEKLKSKRPSDWSISDSEIVYFPALVAAQNLGLAHIVVMPESHYAIRVNNYELMYACRYSQAPKNEAALLEETRASLADDPKTIAQLCEEVDGLNDSLIIHWLSRFELHSCVRSQLLMERHSAYIYLNADDAKTRDDFLKAEQDRNNGFIDSSKLSIVLTCSASALRTGEAHQKKYQEFLDGKRSKTRHERRFPEELIRECINRSGNPLHLFIPNYKCRGNRNDRYSPKQIEIFNKALKQIMASPSRATPTRVLARMDRLSKADPRSIEQVSLESVRLRLKKEDQEKIALAHAGLRGFHGERPPIDPLFGTLRTWVPGLVVHIDSTQWDQRLWKESGFADILPCPWWYGAFDEGSGRCVGASLAFGKSDTFAMSLVMRDMARRLGFLPAFIVTDRGSEFQSILFETLSALCSVSTFLRPAGGARFSSEAENGMRLPNVQMAQRLSGSTFLDKAGRSADGKKKGRYNARMTYQLARQALIWYLFEFFNKNKHGTAPDTPDNLWDEGRLCYPMVGCELLEPQNWAIASSVPVKGTVERLKGIRTYYRTYSSNELSEALKRNETPSRNRIDPEIPTLMYSTIHGQVIKAHDRQHLRLSSLPTEAQVAEQFLHRLRAKENSNDRREQRMKLDTRLDQMEEVADLLHDTKKAATGTDIPKNSNTSVEPEVHKTSGADASPVVPEKQKTSLFDQIAKTKPPTQLKDFDDEKNSSV
ncbi:MAG: hypothetical protein ACREPB_07815 [Arenimonas sp.]